MTHAPRFPISATVQAPEALVLKNGLWQTLTIPIRYGVFAHPKLGNCLIDTGYSERVTSGPRSLALRLYAGVLRPKLSPDILPKAQPRIDTILITHLHADHISALRDYPDAQLIGDHDGLEHFLQKSSLACVRHGVFRELFPDQFRARLTPFTSFPTMMGPLDLGPCFDVSGDGTVLAVPLPGHMRGHYGFVWPRLAAPLLYAADAQWLHQAILEDRMPGVPARWVFDDVEAALLTAARLRAFSRQGGRIVYCHDPQEIF